VNIILAWLISIVIVSITAVGGLCRATRSDRVSTVLDSSFSSKLYIIYLISCFLQGKERNDVVTDEDICSEDD
jgi:hypothetical protein